MTGDLDEKKALAAFTAMLAENRQQTARRESQDFRREVEAERQRREQERNQAQIESARLAGENQLEVIKLLHNLEPEKLERLFRDRVRNENLDLQGFLFRLTAEDNSRERQHQQDVNKEVDMMIIRVLERLIMRKLGLDENTDFNAADIENRLKSLYQNYD